MRIAIDASIWHFQTQPGQRVVTLLYVRRPFVVGSIFDGPNKPPFRGNVQETGEYQCSSPVFHCPDPSMTCLFLTVKSCLKMDTFMYSRDSNPVLPLDSPSFAIGSTGYEQSSPTNRAWKLRPNAPGEVESRSSSAAR